MSDIAPLFQRTHILLGDEGLERLRRARVFLAGLGGVGSFAAEALARAGVGHLTLVDHDTVAASNLNRQLPALHSTVGRLKVDVMAERIRDINPQCELTTRAEFIRAEDMDELLAPGFDFVIDAIDSLNCKAALVETAVRMGIPVASSMGAGGKLDPTRIVVGDLMDTEGCALARAMRKYLRRRGVGRGVLAVFSTEPNRPPLPPEPTGTGRARAVNGTISYMPSLFGLMLAGTVIRRLVGPA
ncbi:MAG: ThiF family adenylyltransferase [Thiohalomonadaceae bacterium]